MNKAIFISIKPKYTKKIETGEKTYEFRRYYPKQKINTLYVYETVPTCALKYIIEIGKVIKYPNKLTKKGYGNQDFNEGINNPKYAYEIKHVYLLKTPISLKELRETYNFMPPQAYAYDTKYPDLANDILKAETTRII